MKSFQKSQKQNDDKGGKHYKMDHPGKGYKDKGHYGKHGKHHYGKVHPNFGYLYINVHGDFGHGNYGQYRSKQAKKKHKHYHPVYEYEARDGFNFIIVRNTFLYQEADYKIDLVRVRLGERRDSGVITVVEYDRSMQRVEVLERRRASLEVNISL
jgi:hypothetical protein